MRKTILLLLIVILLFTACENQTSPTEESTSDSSIFEEINIGETQLSFENYNGLLNISMDFNEGVAWENSGDEKNRREYESDKHIGIAVENDTIVATGRQQILYGEMAVENGNIIGTNHGEFGGGIKFVSNSNKEHEILNENFIGFYIVGDRKFVITGLAHMHINYGYLYELTYSNSRWQAEKILDIGDKPQAFLAVNNDLYIVTNDALLVIRKCY